MNKIIIARFVASALSAALAALVLVGCLQPMTGPRPVTAATTATTSTPAAANPGTESETARLARENADLLQQYRRAYELVTRQANGENVSAEAMQLPNPATPPTPAPHHHGRVAAPPPAPVPTVPAPRPVDTDPLGYGLPVAAPALPTGTPIGSRPLSFGTMFAPRAGVIGSVAYEGPLPEMGYAGGSLYEVTVIDMPHAIGLVVDGRRVCPTVNGRDFAEMATPRGRICVSPPIPRQTRTFRMLFNGQNVRHTVVVEAWGYNSYDPVGEYMGQYSSSNVVPGDPNSRGMVLNPYDLRRE